MKKLLILISGVLILMGCSTNNNGTVTVIPLAPTNLTGTVISTTQVNLSWTDNATNEDGYKVERKTGNGNYAVVGSMGANLTTFNDLGLTPYTSYTYRVYAQNSAGNSLQYSNEVTLITSSVPVLTTNPISMITASSATSGGEITNDGGLSITARGVVWSTTTNPTISLSTKTIDGNGNGSFASNLSSLNDSTTYYIRAYATNLDGTGYGNEISFTTLNVDLVTGLVGFWPFNGNANDESSNGNNGTVNGATLTIDRFGNINKAYSFDGIDDYIVISNSFYNISNSHSMNMWVSVDNVSLGGQYLWNTIPHTGEAFVYNWNNIDNKVTYCLGNGTSGNWSITCGSQNVFLTSVMNQWKMFTLTFASNTWSVFIDGQLVQTYSNSNLPSGLCSLVFGDIAQPWPNGYHETLEGKIDDIRIYNRALTQSEVTYLATH